MTRDEIIHIGVESGLPEPGYPVGERVAGELERFAALIAAAERERIAAEFDRRAVYADGTPSSGWYEPHEPGEIVRGMK